MYARRGLNHRGINLHTVPEITRPAIVGKGGLSYPLDVRLVFLISLVFCALTLADQAVLVALLVLGVYSLTSVPAALRALSLVATIRFLNPTLVALPEGATAVAWIGALAAALRLLATISRRDAGLLAPLVVYSATVGVLAAAGSVAVEISLMKLLSFTLVSAATLVGWARLDAGGRQNMLLWIGSLIAAVLVLSVPTYFVEAVGYATNGFAFQGILNQPQAFGSFLVPVAVWLTANAFAARRAVSAFGLAVISFVWVLMLSSLSRNAAVASLLALSLGATLVWLRSGGLGGQQAQRLILTMTWVAIALFITALAFPAAADRIIRFVSKYGEIRTVAESFNESRGWLIDLQWQSFLARPWTGHGFQVYPSGVFPSGVTEIMGIPVAASVEKGFIGTAVLEETGIIGAVVFLGLVIGLLRTAMAKGDLASLCLLLACLFINLGECVLFAAGGLGLYVWLLIGMAVSGAEGEVHHAT